MELDFQACDDQVRKIACTRGAPSYVDKDDLIQVGWIGMLKAVRGYNPARGSFGTYASHRIRGEILDHMRREDHLSRCHRAAVKRGEAVDMQRVPLDRVSDPDNTAYTIADGTVDTEALTLSHERAAVARQLIQTCMGVLPYRLQIVVQKYWLDGKTMRVVGLEMGVNETHIRQLNVKALWLMRQAMTTRDTARAADVLC